jgi:hypothetical protein
MKSNVKKFIRKYKKISKIKDNTNNKTANKGGFIASKN